MKVVKVQPFQTIFDIAIQEYGSVEFVSTIILDNGVDASDLFNLEGVELIINAQGVGNEIVKGIFSGKTVHNNFGQEVEGSLITLDRDDIQLDSEDITLDTLYG